MQAHKGEAFLEKEMDLEAVIFCSEDKQGALEAEVLNSYQANIEFLNLKQENLDLKNPNIKHLNYLNIGASKLTHEEVESSMNKMEHASAVHTGEKQHVSKTCGKCFATHGDIRNHMKIHMGSSNTHQHTDSFEFESLDIFTADISEVLYASASFQYHRPFITVTLKIQQNKIGIRMMEHRKLRPIPTWHLDTNYVLRTFYFLPSTFSHYM